MKARFACLALFVVCVAGLVALPVLAAEPQQTPTLKLDPDRGPYGTTVAVNVYGFIAGQTCQLSWDGDYQTDIVIDENGQGSSSLTISDKYSIGWHKVMVGNCNQTQDWAEADFEIILPATLTFTLQKPSYTPTFTLQKPSYTPTFTPQKITHTPTFTSQKPSDTPTPTKQPGQPGGCGPGTCTITPSITPSATGQGLILYPIIIPPREPYVIPRIPIPQPQVCSGLSASAEQRIFDFEGASGSLGTTYQSLPIPYQVSFINANAQAPSVRTRSGSTAAGSTYGDMGSYNTPIRMSFNSPMLMVGMYVGRDAPQYDRGEVSAVLTGYGYNRDGTFGEIAVASIILPAQATDIDRCLSIRAPDGLSIRSATLEYYTRDGRSAVDRRWMDDLTLVPAGGGGRDEPPQVTINSPLNGRTVLDDGSVTFSVTVIEDINLTRMEFGIPTSMTRTSVAFHPATGGDPTRYEANFTIRPGDGLVAEGDNTFLVNGIDSAGQVGSAQVTFRWEPRPPLNIEAYKIEIVQVVQCLDTLGCTDNSVPMVDDKPMLVRLYVRTNGRVVNNIGGRLCLDSTSPDCSGDYIDSYNLVTIGPSGDPVADYHGDLARTLNFMVPASRLARNSSNYLNMYATVNYQRRDADEARYDDNSRFVYTYVEPHKTLEIAFVPVCINRVCPINPSATIGPILTFISHMYPTHTIDWVMYSNHVLRTSYTNFHLDDDPGCNKAWDNTLSSLWWYNLWTSDFASWVRYYGLLADALNPQGRLGCGYTPGDESGGIVNNADWSAAHTAAEEIGHNHYLVHAPSGGARGADPNYPVRSGHLDAWGLDIYRMHLFDPANTYDFMGYAGNYVDGEWASTYNYINLMLNIGVEAESLEHWLEQVTLPGGGRAAAMIVPRQQGAPVDALVISGYISPTGVEIPPDGVQHVTVYDPPPNPSMAGPYTIQLLDAQGNVLYTSPWFAAEVGDGEQSESGPFHAVVPWMEGTTAIWFNYNGGVIGGVAGNDTPPGVEFIDPAGDAAWGESGTVLVSWVGKDVEALTYSLLFSPDGGVTWSLLTNGLSEQQFEIDLSSLAGTTQGKLRVVASDGFNTASADSQGMITIPNKAPLLVITSPQDGYSLPQTYPLILEGIGTDYEDGPMGAEGFRWVSNIDGELGSGTGLILSDLSVGQHTISLLAADSQGLQGEVTVQVNIQPAPTLVPEETTAEPQAGVTDTPQAIATPAPAGAGDSTPLIIALGAALLVALVVIIVLLGRRKK